MTGSDYTEPVRPRRRGSQDLPPGAPCPLHGKPQISPMERDNCSGAARGQAPAPATCVRRAARLHVEELTGGWVMVLLVYDGAVLKATLRRGDW